MYHFCGEFAFPMKKYYTFLAETYSASDQEVLHQEVPLQWSTYDAPVSRATLLSLRDECIMGMLNGGNSEGATGRDNNPTRADICLLFSISDRYIVKLTSPEDLKLKFEDDGSKAAIAAEYNRKHEDAKKGLHIVNDPRYKDVMKMIAYARMKAHNGGIYGKFAPLDVFPNMHFVHGNVGAHNSIRSIPNVCPVLRIPLVWDNGNRILTTPRVWRKTNTLPFGPDNVIVMSKLAAWVIEGTYALNRVNAALDTETRAAWKNWQEKHPFRPVSTRLDPYPLNTNPTTP